MKGGQKTSVRSHSPRATHQVARQRRAAHALHHQVRSRDVEHLRDRKAMRMRVLQRGGFVFGISPFAVSLDDPIG